MAAGGAVPELIRGYTSEEVNATLVGEGSGGEQHYAVDEPRVPDRQRASAAAGAHEDGLRVRGVAHALVGLRLTVVVEPSQVEILRL